MQCTLQPVIVRNRLNFEYFDMSVWDQVYLEPVESGYRVKHVTNIVEALRILCVLLSVRGERGRTMKQDWL